ncbi:MAG: tetratricopeptide repeat protein [Caldilineaceae bacterium]
MVEITAEYPRAIAWIERGGAFATSQQRAQLLAWRGFAAEQQGDYEQASEYCYASLALSGNDPVLQILIFNRLSSVLWSMTRYPEARTYAEQALQLSRGSSDPSGIASSLTSLGRIAMYTVDPHEAQGYFSGIPGDLSGNGGSQRRSTQSHLFRHHERGVA